MSSETPLELLARRAEDPRAQVLLEAAVCVMQDRNTSYGEPEDNFSNIGEMWTLRLRQWGLLKPESIIPPALVALMQSDIKDCRMIQTPDKPDHWIDRAGYTACGYRCAVMRPIAPLTTSPK